MKPILTFCNNCKLTLKTEKPGNVCPECKHGLMVMSNPSHSGRVGMYDETPRIKVGKYTICRQDPDGENKLVWIEYEDGEGGEFQDSLFEPVIDDFFKKYL